MPWCSTAHPNASRPGAARTSMPAPTTSESRSSAHRATIRCPATGRSLASSFDAGHWPGCSGTAVRVPFTGAS
jgi:hypothetical protein